jgi:sucrose-phosphate synthase
MHIAFLNPQGNFDPLDSYWTEHPDFGGQLVYVKEVALAMAAQGHLVDIITRQIIDDKWPEFADPLDAYPGHEDVRIVRIPCGPSEFLPKEQLWPHLGSDWVRGILAFYEHDGGRPDFFTAHYADGGLVAAILDRQTGIPYTFTGHSLGAQKMDKLQVSPKNLAELNARYNFAQRIFAERISMNHAARIITSTRQEQMEQYSHPAYRGAVDVNETGGPHFAIIPPGVNRQVFSPETGPVDAAVRDRIEAAMARDLAPDRQKLPLVICSSRLDRKKNHLALVRAFVENADLRNTANLAIVVRGLDDPLNQRGQLSHEERAILDEIVDLLDSHRLRRVVTAFPLNSQPELAAAYRVAAARHSVFALTAHYEPFGLAPLEAMSCGLPAVVTRNGGPAESMYSSQTKREYGVLVNPADPQDIARGLLQALNSPEAWQKYHQAGLERVITRYTWERTAEGYLAVIEEMLTAQKMAPDHTKLLIPLYFTQPVPENEISLDELTGLYFRKEWE